MPKKDENDFNWVPESAFGVWFLGTKTWKTQVLKRALNDLETLMENRKVRYPTILDIGYGHGFSLIELEERFSPDKIIALDIDPNAPSLAALNAKQSNCEIRFLTNDAASIAVPDQNVDLVFCHQTFHHLIDQEKVIQEFHRVLKPGGVLLFAESCKRYIHSFLIRLLFRHPMHVQKTDGEYIRLIKNAGFTFSDNAISYPYLWWNREDLGILEKLGRKEPEDREETLLNLVATKPA